MKTTLIKAKDRSFVDRGWVNSYHSITFRTYKGTERENFGPIIFIGDDTVKPGMGFGEHPHDNMEIISIPLRGNLEHRDTTGRRAIIKHGDVQIMSAGTGIWHSEMNANSDKEVNFLQIWVLPTKKNIEPRYEQKTFLASDRLNKIQTVVAPDNAEALWINQQAWFSLVDIEKNHTITYTLRNRENGVFALVISGDVSINNIALNERDNLGILETEIIQMTTHSQAEVLLMEVPMQFVQPYSS